MGKHNYLGKRGEQEAVCYLTGKGYRILHTNWRFNRLELDIVAFKENTLVVIEVKTRKSTEYALPHEAVTPLKVLRIVKATHAYIKYFGIDFPVRFDIITLVGEEDSFHIEHLENAFYPPPLQ